MKIGEVAQRVGVPIDTVRYYERNGLIPPPARRASGYRDYREGDVTRLKFVLRAKALGFRLTEIRDLLSLSDASDGDMRDVNAATRAKLRDIDVRIANLTQMRHALQSLLDLCPGQGDLDGCPIRSALLDTLPPKD